MFAIDSVTGQITTTQRLDREEMDSHVFDIIASDSETPSLSAEAVVRIDVEDRNDHEPAFESDLYTVSVLDSLHTIMST